MPCQNKLKCTHTVQADKNLQKYSKTLLTHLPEQTTQLLIDLCTGALVSKSPAPEQASSPTPSAKNRTYALQSLSALPFASTPGNSSPVSEISGRLQDTTLSDRHAKTTSSDGLPYTLPSARTFMPSFVDRPDCLVQLLERVYEKRWASPSPSEKAVSDAASVRSYGTRDERNNHQAASEGPTLSPQEREERKAIWNTLLELYLMDEQSLAAGSPASRADPMNDRERQKRRKNFRVKALSLLKDDAIQYDSNQALMLCQLKQFDEGIVYLYEKKGMYNDILRFWMDKEETDRVIEAVRKYGPKDPSLYPMVLTYFSSSPDILSKSTPELLSVLNHIDSEDLLPPIQVVQALSRSNVATIGLIKRYIGNKIEQENQELKQVSILYWQYLE